jgi:hypothetical protein
MHVKHHDTCTTHTQGRLTPLFYAARQARDNFHNPLLARCAEAIHYLAMKEILVYGISGIASLFIFGYSVHMFVGGLVSEQVEIGLIALVVIAAAAAEVYFIRDALLNRRM